MNVVVSPLDACTICCMRVRRRSIPWNSWWICSILVSNWSIRKWARDYIIPSAYRARFVEILRFECEIFKFSITDCGITPFGYCEMGTYLGLLPSVSFDSNWCWASPIQRPTLNVVPEQRSSCLTRNVFFDEKYKMWFLCQGGLLGRPLNGALYDWYHSTRNRSALPNPVLDRWYV